MTVVLERQNSSFPSPAPPDLLLDISADRIARKIWWTNREFHSVDIIPPWFSMLIYGLRVVQ
jgi:hypothetical protein